MRDGSTSPSTAIPYFGSGSSTVWPPPTTKPPARAASSPPASTSASRSLDNSSKFHATRFSASRGLPPMAYTSDTELVAAMRPQVRASSTTGVMKSAVSTRARPRPMRHTAASSPVAKPTSNSGGGSGVKPRTTCARSPGAILQPQPAPWLNSVSRRAIAVTPSRARVAASCGAGARTGLEHPQDTRTALQRPRTVRPLQPGLGPASGQREPSSAPGTVGPRPSKGQGSGR